MLRSLAQFASWVCIRSFAIPMRALALSADRPWLIPVSVALFVISSPLLLLAWMAYPIAGLAAVCVAKREGAAGRGPDR
jgi:hypothetical protein